MKINQKGFSLTELMIALVLGLILLGGAISVFLSNQATGRSNNAISEIQNIARIGSLLMSYDIRNAGFSGCNNVRISNVIAISGARPDWGDWEFGGGIKGRSSGECNRWSDSGGWFRSFTGDVWFWNWLVN